MERKSKKYLHSTSRKAVPAAKPAENSSTNPTNITAAPEIGDIMISERFALLNRLITRDLNQLRDQPVFSVYSKEEIQKYIGNPYRYEKQLRSAVVYIYGASPHFRRIIQYFVGLTDWCYVITPYKIDPKKASDRIVSLNYRRTLNVLDSMQIRTQFEKILTVCLREDVCYCTMWITGDSITFQILPSEYCAISTVEGNVPNVSFDFSYFTSRKEMLAYYPKEFEQKYRKYESDRKIRWQELDSPTSFAIKCNKDVLEYAMPPFAGVLREVYELEDYKQLRLSKTALENYAMIAMELPMDDDGNWILPYTKAKQFWENLDKVLPEEVGSVLTPMKLSKISFEKTNTGDTDVVADSEQEIFSSAGVSSLLFNNERASGSALALSIKADQSITFGIVKSIEDAINRFLHSQSYSKNYSITFLDVSPFNRKEMADQYLKAATYGLPTISAYAATVGLSQSAMDSMSYLESQILDLQGMFRPLKSATNTSSDLLKGEAATDEGGAPTKDDGELTDSGEISRETE